MDSNSIFVDAMLNRKKQSGYITLLSILVVGAVGVSISVSLLLLGLGNSRTGLSLQQMYQAKALADACAEEALIEVQSSVSFAGSGSLAIGRGTCSYSVTNQGGQNRTVTAMGTIGTIVRKTEVVLSKITPNIAVASWQEVGDL